MAAVAAAEPQVSWTRAPAVPQPQPMPMMRAAAVRAAALLPARHLRAPRLTSQSWPVEEPLVVEERLPARGRSPRFRPAVSARRLSSDNGCRHWATSDRDTDPRLRRRPVPAEAYALYAAARFSP